jgi:GNAT superfamily N-acetyltransferase
VPGHQRSNTPDVYGNEADEVTISYSESLDGLTPDHLRGGFFEHWASHPTPETHVRLLRGSDHVVLALDDDTGHVVGFITAISDGVLAAYIPFLEVLPAYRECGIGGELLRRMRARLSDLYMVDLLCDEHLQPWYSRFGMLPATGMMARNYARQSGSRSATSTHVPAESRATRH